MHAESTSIRTIQLSFATLHVLCESTVETIVDEGIIIDMGCVHEYHAALKTIHPERLGLLIDKRNSYSYTFEAQIHLPTLPQIQAIAVITYTENKWASVYSLQSLPPNRQLNLKKFWSRDPALRWLQLELG